VRGGQNVNRRVQNAFKEKLLCRDCEARLNNWETDFANRLFCPRVNKKQSPLEYGAWFLNFVVSLSWRSLLCCKRIGLSQCNFTDRQKRESDLALDVWRRFLLGEIEHVGQYQQHVIPVDIVFHDAVSHVPSHINQYYLRCADIEPVANPSQALILVKIPYFIFFGAVQHDERDWINTTVQTPKGVMGSSRCVVPESFAGYIVDRARSVGDIFQGISQRQRSRIEHSIQSDPNRVAQSETLRAVRADLELPG